jgi:hypothetical protein
MVEVKSRKTCVQQGRGARAAALIYGISECVRQRYEARPYALPLLGSCVLVASRPLDGGGRIRELRPLIVVV